VTFFPPDDRGPRAIRKGGCRVRIAARRSHLEQLRKQAKDLAREHRRGDGAARARVRAYLPRPGEPLKLSQAQLVIARELGFASWPRLRAYVKRLAAHGPALQHAFHEDPEYYEGRADGLLASAEDETDGAVAAFARHDAPLTRVGAREVVAHEHGFASWAALRRHVAGLRRQGSRSPAPSARLRRTRSTVCAGCSTSSRNSSARAGLTATTSSAWRQPPATSGS
jgi:hypothetical protein